MAEGNAYIRINSQVQFHRLAVICPGGIGLSPALKYGTEVGIIDSLSEFAAERLLAGKGKTEYAVGNLQIAQGKLYVANAVQTDNAAFHRPPRLLVGQFFTVGQRLIMRGGCIFEYAHPAIVGAYVVKCLYDFKGV